MTPIRKPRGYRRVAQACSTCKRKKVRCPGEKPQCSHCVRLRQNCHYPGSTTTEFNGIERSRAESNPAIGSTRYASLGNGSNFIQRHVSVPHESMPAPEATPASTFGPSTALQAPNSSLLPPQHVFERAIGIYFVCAHLQPLWLFVPGDFLNQEPCEELLLTILAVGVQFSPIQFKNDNLLSPQVYSDAARSLIMSGIANARLNIQVLQALCLLAFYYLLAGQTTLANFHTTLVKTLLQSSGLDSETSQLAEQSVPQRRLAWSILFLDSICGQHLKVPSFSDELHNTRYVAAQGRLNSTLGKLPQLPEESYVYDDKDTSLRIWAYSLKISCVWREARLYILRCTEGDMTAPWKPKSSYSLILSQTTDFESTYPTEYRYDTSSLVSAEQIAGHPQFWWPWVRIQFMYHTIYCVLNHPFLYPATSSKLGPNGFWKNASQLALLHSTWIARLIIWATNKGLPLNEPFYTQAAVLAATLHAYWTRANDPTIKSAAKKHLDICRSFVEEKSGRWPICRDINNLLDDFLRLTIGPDAQARITLEHSAAIENSMWKILDCVIAQPEEPGKGLFERCYGRGRQTDLRGQPDQFNVEDPDITSQASDIYNAGACNAPRPDWFPPTATASEHGGVRQRGGEPPITLTNDRLAQPPQVQSLQQGNSMGGVENPPLLFDWAGGVSGTAGFHDPDVRYPWQDSLSWALDFGNL